MNISSFDIKEKFKSVKNVVMQVTPVEAKVRACTSNDPWGAKSTDKSEVAEATYNFEDYKIVMQTIWKRMSDTGKDWRHVYKALQLLEYLIVHGSERVHEEAKDSLYTIRSLRSFRYVDEKGKDYGEGIRELAKKMVKFIQDEKQVQEEREKAKALSGKYSGFSRAESRYQGGGSKSRSQPRRYDDEEDRPQRKKTYDDDEDDRPQRKPQARPTRRDEDDDEEDSPPVQRKPQRNIFEGDEEDSYSARRQDSRQDSRQDTSARPRAPSNGTPQQSNVRKPRPPSPDFEAPPTRTTPQKTQPKQTAGVADFFGPSQDSFFDDDNFGAPQGGQQQGGFNPRTGGQQQQQQDFDANFEGDFDNDFPEDEFGNYKGGEAPEKKDNLFSITEGLVNFDLNDTKKPSQGGQSGTLQPSNATTGSNQPLTLSQKAKLQGKKIPTTTNIGRGAPTGMLPPQGGGGFGGMPPQGGGFGGPPQGFGGAPPQGGGFGGMPPQGGGYGMPPQGGGYGVPQGGGFGGQPQYPPMGRGVPPQGGGFQGGFGGQPQGGFGGQPQGFGGAPQGGFGGQPQGGFQGGFGVQPQGGGRGQPQYGGQPMGRGAPQPNRPPVMQNNNDPFF